MTRAEQLSNIIKDNDLYGRSFTLGVALYYGVTKGCITLEFKNAFEDMCEEYYYDLANTLEQANVHHNASVWAEMLDISVLDDMARTLTGEDEGEDE